MVRDHIIARKLAQEMESALQTSDMHSDFQKMMDFLHKLSDAYAKAIEAGADQKRMFDKVRDAVVKQYKVPQENAANFVRIVNQMAANKLGAKLPYSQSDMKIIIDKAFKSIEASAHKAKGSMYGHYWIEEDGKGQVLIGKDESDAKTGKRIGGGVATAQLAEPKGKQKFMPLKFWSTLPKKETQEAMDAYYAKKSPGSKPLGIHYYDK